MERRVVVVGLQHEVGGATELLSQWHPDMLRQDLSVGTHGLQEIESSNFITLTYKLGNTQLEPFLVRKSSDGYA